MKIITKNNILKTLLSLTIYISILTIPTQQHIQVSSPKDLVEYYKKANVKINGGIRNSPGKFGEIPYGKTITGYTYFHYTELEKNDYCKRENFVSVDFMHQNNYSAIAMAMDDDKCKFTDKALVAQQAGAVAMIIISKDNTYATKKNVDDLIKGGKIYIPTFIISKDDGEKLFDTYTKDKKTVILNLSFKSIVEGNKVELELFLRSDEVKSLQFFKEFYKYIVKLSDNIDFIPRYKYITCHFCPSSNKLEDKSENACLNNGDYCGGYNAALGVNDSRLVLLENLRQKCVFSIYSTELYFQYMINFSDLCADMNNPSFTAECSHNVIKTVGLIKTDIEKCMQDNIDSKLTFMSDDKDTFDKNKVYRYPRLHINGIKYQGSWYGKHIFNTICNGFFENHDMCKDPVKIIDNEEVNSFPAGVILLLIIGVIFLIITMIYCYRRSVNKTIDESIEERIERQTKDSMGHYSNMNSTSLTS